MHVRQLRESLGINQTEFWDRVGVTQSGGSRYENGRRIPKAVQMLITIAYGSRQEMKSTEKRLRFKGTMRFSA